MGKSWSPLRRWLLVAVAVMLLACRRVAPHPTLTPVTAPTSAPCPATISFSPPRAPGAVDWSVPRAVAAIPRLGRIYSADEDRTMAVVDEDSGEVVASVYTGLAADGLAADPERGLLYLLGSDRQGLTASLSVYDAAGQKETRRIDLGRGRGRAIFVDAKRNAVYAVTSGVDLGDYYTRVWAVDGAGGEVINSVTYPECVLGLALDPATGQFIMYTARAFTTEYYLTWLEGRTLAEQKRMAVTGLESTMTFDPRSSVTGLALDAGGAHLYWPVRTGDARGSVLQALDVASGQITATAALGVVPEGVACDPGRGEIYVVGNEGPVHDYCLVLEAASLRVLERLPLVHGVRNPSYTAAVLDPARPRLYIHSWDGGLTVLDTADRTMRGIVFGYSLRDLAYDPATGRLFACSFNGDVVFVVDTHSGCSVGRIAGVGAYPYRLLLDSALERLYVLGYGGLSAVDTRSLTVVQSRELAESPCSAALNTASHRLYLHFSRGSAQVSDSILALDGRTLEDVQRGEVGRQRQGPCGQVLAVDAGHNRLYVGRHPVSPILDATTLALLGELPWPAEEIAVDEGAGLAYLYEYEPFSRGPSLRIVELKDGSLRHEYTCPAWSFQVRALNGRLRHAYTAEGWAIDTQTLAWAQLGAQAIQVAVDEAAGLVYMLNGQTIRVERDVLEPGSPEWGPWPGATCWPDVTPEPGAAPTPAPTPAP